MLSQQQQDKQSIEELEDKTFYNVFSFINLYDAYSFIPHVCKRWRRMFENWSTPNQHMCDEQIETLKYISRSVLRDYEIFRYCESQTPEQFAKLIDDRSRRKISLSPRPISARSHSKRYSLSQTNLLSWLSDIVREKELESGAGEVTISVSPRAEDSTCVTIRVLFEGRKSSGKSHLYHSMQTKRAYSVHVRGNSTLPMSREFNVKGKQYSIQLIDGHENKPDNSEVNLIYLCFDITSQKSFDYIKKNWGQRVTKKQKLLGHRVDRVLVGTKYDLKAKRKVSRKTAEDFAHSLGIIYIEVSSHKYMNVSQLHTYALYRQIYLDRMNSLGITPKFL